MEYVQDNGFREQHGAVTNRTYRTWRTAKLTLGARFVTVPTVRKIGQIPLIRYYWQDEFNGRIIL